MKNSRKYHATQETTSPDIGSDSLVASESPRNRAGYPGNQPTDPHR